MRNLVLLLVVLLILIILGGVVALALWEPEPPTAPMEKVIPNEKLQG